MGTVHPKLQIASLPSLLSRTVIRQFRFPTPLRGIIETALLGAVFLAAGRVSLGHGLPELLGPMVPVVFALMLCMVFSGVYRREITNSIMHIYVHSLYGFFLATFAFIVTVYYVAPDYLTAKFVFFFLFFAFFVLNTVRPLISGTEFNVGEGRHGN